MGIILNKAGGFFYTNLANIMNAMRRSTFGKFVVNTKVATDRIRKQFGPPRRGNLRVAQSRTKRRPGYCSPSPSFRPARAKA